MTETELTLMLKGLRRAPGRGGSEGRRAPHKPLLLLGMLSRLEQDPAHPNRFEFLELKQAFDQLWPAFGWNTPTRAAYPFWYLTSDGFWRLVGDRGPLSISGERPPTERLIEQKVRFGQLSDEAWLLLRQPEIRRRAISFLVEHYFPDSAQPELREMIEAASIVALPARSMAREDEEWPVTRNSPRDARFRENVMLAYERKCGVCGFGPQHAKPPSAVQAAHVWPVQFGGPCDIQNGVALCSIHHWALDSGALSFDDDRKILVSARVIDGPAIESMLRAYSGHALANPLPGYPTLATRWLALHRKELFIAPALATT
jgi:putative restriction endonuclease